MNQIKVCIRRLALTTPLAKSGGNSGGGVRHNPIEWNRRKKVNRWRFIKLI